MTTKKISTKNVVVRAKPYQRTEALPELSKGVKLPNGYTPAYFRKRAHLAVLRAADRSHYIIFNIDTGDRVLVASTKEASQAMSAILHGKKVITNLQTKRLATKTKATKTKVKTKVAA